VAPIAKVRRPFKVFETIGRFIYGDSSIEAACHNPISWIEEVRKSDDGLKSKSRQATTNHQEMLIRNNNQLSGEKQS
jgi:hypothetical protein